MIFWFSLLIVITLLIFSVISINYTEETIMKNSIDYTTRLIKQVSRDINSYITYMENISTLVVKGGDVQRYMFAGEDTEDEKELYNRIVTQFNTIVEVREDISNIAVVTPERAYIINDGRDSLNENVQLSDVAWYMQALEGEGSILTPSHVQHVIKNNYKWVVTLGQGIKNPKTNQNEAVFFIDLNYRLLKDLCEKNTLAANDYVFIVDQTGKIIYHPKQQLLYSGLRKEKVEEVLSCDSSYFVAEDGDQSMLYTISVEEKTGWRIVGVVSLSELMSNQAGNAEAVYADGRAASMHGGADCHTVSGSGNRTD